MVLETTILALVLHPFVKKPAANCWFNNYLTYN